VKSGKVKKGPAVPSHDQVIEMVRELGGEQEVKRFESVEALEKTHGQHGVLHQWKIGNIMKPSFEEYDKETIRVYAIGLQRDARTLYLSVRLAMLYKEPKLRELLTAAAKSGHELSWNHFRRLMVEGLTDDQRAELVSLTVKNRWGYRELESVIVATLGGKKSKGGRKPGKTKYKTYAGALSAMKMRSRAWLALEDDWIDQVKVLANKMAEDERHTPEFLALTTEAATQLRDVANKAQRDAEEAEEIANSVRKAMGDPDLTEEVTEDDDEPVQPTNGKHRVPTAHKNGKAKTKPRVRLAKHPKMVNGKVVAN
jgi:hypothetical protein